MSLIDEHLDPDRRIAPLREDTPPPETWDNPGDLRMLSYVPAGLPAGAPLVVVLHGCGQSAEALAAGAGWLTLAETHGFALLCPEQKRGNNFNACFNWFVPEDARRGGGEAHSIAQMTLSMRTRSGLDPARVFVAGLSAGGAMTNVLLASYPELYAGGAVIAGLPYGAARGVTEAMLAMRRGSVHAPETLAEAVLSAAGHRGPWPRVSVWHGDLDSTVAPANAGAIIRQWADVHQMSAAPPLTENLGARQRRIWSGANGEAVLELNIIAGLNHAWALATAGADGCGVPGPFLVESEISTSAEILRFWGIHAEQRLATLAPEQLSLALPGPRGKLAAPPARGPDIPAQATRRALPAPNAQPDLLAAAASAPCRRLTARLRGFLNRLLPGGRGKRK